MARRARFVMSGIPDPAPDRIPADRIRKEKLRLWHDDIRLPPEGWVWARTNAQAQQYLATGLVTECSLDHDLGCHNLDAHDPQAKFYAGASQEGSGYDLVCWMVENNLVPPKVTVHSWNPVGAAQMAARLRKHGHECVVRPYEVRKAGPSAGGSAKLL